MNGAIKTRKTIAAKQSAGMLIIIAAIYIVLQQYGILSFLMPRVLATADMSIWLMFVVGLTASAHCAVMCGGINLSQRPGSVCSKDNRFAVLRPSLLYNLGRVISYTVAGIIAGALGSVFSLSPNAHGFLKLIAGTFMVATGIAMLGMFPGLRKIIHKTPKGQTPLIVGFFNGFMPCGPLRIAHIYAMSTGSPAKGALAMALFALGTIPSTFAVGAFGAVIGKRYSRKVATASAVMIAVFGLCMLSQSWNLFGLKIPTAALASNNNNVDGGELKIDIDLGPQIINSELKPYGYPSIKVEPGRPVRWIIDAPPGSVNGCNERFIIREYGIDYTLKPGENIIEFTPMKEGRTPYTCRMGMITGTITVTRDAVRPENKNDPEKKERTGPRCC